jgi:pimeloyl-ACP methyl ester carboxylesterase
MSNQRTHDVTTTDGVTIVGTVYGQGPPLVFTQGGIGDGDLDWQALVAHLTGRFTCHLPSVRGRGLSTDHPDLGFGRLSRIWSPTSTASGRRPDWWAGPTVAWCSPWRRSPTQWMRWRRSSPRSSVSWTTRNKRLSARPSPAWPKLAAQGDMTEAARAFGGFPFNDAEIAKVDKAGYFEAAGRYVPTLLNQLQQGVEYQGPTADDPAVLGAISAPVLVLHGSDTKQRALAAGAQYVADHVPNATVREIPGAGHAAPLTHPEALAEALTEFFSSAQQPA